jgi:hypothetical protein
MDQGLLVVVVDYVNVELKKKFVTFLEVLLVLNGFMITFYA